MKLERLLKNLKDYKIYGRENIDVLSVSDDSRNVKKGGLFIAVKGLTTDGHSYIPQAIEKGVRVIVGDKKPSDKWIRHVTYVEVGNSKNALAVIAKNWFGNPSSKLKVIGVTGTKGKTTTTHMIFHILAVSGKRVGLISSITYPGLHVTTPDCLELNKKLKEMVDEGSMYAVIEVSSHGIDQGRVAGLMFEVGVLTNIAPEHLDYHKTFARYKKTKMDFVNSIGKQVICPKDTDIDIFPGKFNNLNAEAAVLAVQKLGISRQNALKHLRSFKLPRGRLEEIKNKKGFRIFVDFAHTTDSLEQVLTYLKTKTQGNLIAVFGCAGERDVTKRSLMGEVSVKIADTTVLTAEDPRSEDVNLIIEQIVEGAKKVLNSKEININNFHTIMRSSNAKYKYYFRIPERGEAISFAIQKLAKRGDTVVICGKGHEKSMCYSGVEYPWSDQEAVKVALKGGTKKIKR